MAKPKYPTRAKDAAMEGTVLLRLTVDRHGDVTKVKLLRSSAPKILVDESIEAAFKCRFKPALVDGRPIVSSIDMPFQFQIRR